MVRSKRLLLFVVTLAFFAVGCSTSTRVDAADVPATPIPTQAPIFAPTTPPAPPTPAPATDESSASEGATSSEGTDATIRSETTEPASADTQADESDAEVEPSPTPTVTPIPTPTADVLPVPTRAPRPQPRPTPRPTLAPAPVCPGGQVLGSNGLCSCPAGTANRASDGLCVRLCNQADLTVSNSCVCTGALYDSGGQCVKRCTAGEVPDGFGGCKFPDNAAVN